MSVKPHVIPVWIVLLLLVVGAVPPEPRDPILDVDPPKRPPVVAAWLRGVTAGPRSMVVTVASQLSSYSEISAFSYTIERDGSLTANNPVNDAVLIDFARLNGIRVVPTISSTWEATNITGVLKDPALRSRHVDAIMKVARSPLVDGIDLDYENLPPETRQPFTEFVTALGNLLHREGKTLSITVPPKVRDDPASTITWFADYAALGAAADHIRVMAYEFHGKSGGPAANAPVWWMRRVMEYTASQMPRSKAILGIHLYAYDWGGKDTPAMWWNDVQRLKERYHGEVTYVESDANGIVGESILSYTIPGPRCPRYEFDCVESPGERHTVWFADAKYVALSWDIVKDLGLGGIVMWRPGGEDPAIWDAINPLSTAATN